MSYPTQCTGHDAFFDVFDALQTGTRRQEQRATYVGQLTDGG